MTRRMRKKYLLKFLKHTRFYRTLRKEQYMITLHHLRGTLLQARVEMGSDLSINGKIQNSVQTLITFQIQAQEISQRIPKTSTLFSRILSLLSLSLIYHFNLVPLPLKWLIKFLGQFSQKTIRSNFF